MRDIMKKKGKEARQNNRLLPGYAFEKTMNWFFISLKVSRQIDGSPLETYYHGFKGKPGRATASRGRLCLA